VPAAAGQGGHGQHGPRGGQRLLGGQSPDRRVGRGAAVRRAGRGLVRAAVRRRAAAAARAGAAPGGVSPRHRLAGAQAGRVRRLPLPRGPVPQQCVPPGLRCLVPAAAGAVGEGVPAHPLPGRAADGGRGGRGADAAAGGRRAVERGGGGGGAGAE
jgi:hypothetical protein